MLKSQKITIEQSEIRQKLNGLPDDADEVEVAELTARYDKNETLYRAAVIAEGEARQNAPQPDAEHRERGKLLQAANVGAIFQAAYEQRATTGKEAEIQAAYGIGSWDVPIGMLSRELRDTVGSAQAPADVGQNQQPVAPAIFPTAVAEAMGVMRVSVPTGQATFPTMTAPVAGPDAVAEGATVTDTTGTFTADALAPARIQRSFTHSIEDAAQFAQMGDALRENLAGAIGDGLDRQALNKTGEGLLDFGSDPTAATGAETFARYRTAAYGRVDGRYANSIADVRLLVGSETYAHMASVYRGNSADDSALDSLMRMLGGLYVSANVAAAASNIQQAVFNRGMGQRHAVQPVWDAVGILVDPYTESKDGNIRLTATALANFKVTRADGLHRVAFRLA